MSKQRSGHGRIFMPDHSLILPPHRQGPGQGAWPISAAAPATNRYDNSGALLWYKMGDAAPGPFVNSGDGGVRDLAYETYADMAVATFGAASIFTDGTAAELTNAAIHCRYSWTGDDSAILTNSATVWAWATIHSLDFRAGPIWGRCTGDGTERGAAMYGPFNLVTWGTNGTHTSLRVGFKVAGFDSTASAWWAVSFDVPHLLAGTFDGARVRAYVDGVDTGAFFDIAGSFDNTANDRWCFGDMVFAGSSYSPVAAVYECGFDNSVYSEATLLDMYTTAGV